MATEVAEPVLQPNTPEGPPVEGPTEEDLKAAMKKGALLDDNEEQILFSCNICYDVSVIRVSNTSYNALNHQPSNWLRITPHPYVYFHGLCAVGI